ncbi:MMPL/RND family transporter [Mycolicibacterium thermoresistibile]|uniref:Transporter n=2 Tax=Mycolicibacterium thermoresistibile TaxID=1797 RepID=G7CDU1_MYCT3|nr:MMPL family transporter [Mycolicibacterium thermoresistibile]EHI13770.1 transporter [Mycolicibacterium thermoresistibile ATCC 19527]MCV7190763.1 MMPL family transporter [Mycolicibacterium thermoresistibile]GAT16822.1 transporter [Mycolicibacterium thermoresistibile]SNW17949.1 transporter [Mycolicibacterium thermoresistibile]
MTANPGHVRTDEAPTDRLDIKVSTHGPSFISTWIRRLSLPIIVGWIALIALLNITVPQLEVVGEMRAVSMSPDEAPSMVAMKRVGELFDEGSSDSQVMIVLEGEEPLGADARAFYDELVKRLEADDAHVENVQDLWSDPLTATGVQSPDGKSAYVQVKLAGNQGEALANESVETVREMIATVSEEMAPEGVQAFVTGGAAMSADQQEAGDSSLRVIEALTFLVITTMLLFVYRSVITVLIALFMVLIGLLTTRGVVAFLGYHNIIGLSTFATSLLVTLAIAIAVDYAIFLIGRYQEARSVGADRATAYHTMFGGTAHVILASGLTIAGATFCLSFTRLPYFQSLGPPLAIGMIVLIVTSLTMGPAIITVATRFGLLEPKRAARVRFWRKVGASVVRWPGPIMVTTVAVTLVGLLALPGYRTNYNDRNYLPASFPSNAGYEAAERHFDPARLNPELLLIESDHDLRNPADFLVIEKIAKAVFQVEGISRVQGITRPEGTPIEHSSIPFMISQQGTLQILNQQYMQDRMADMLVQADEMQLMIDTMDKMIALMEEMVETTDNMVRDMDEMAAHVAEMRDSISEFDDFFRPIRNYFYWEPHCYNIPVCWAMRSVFDTLDGINTMTDDIQNMLPHMHRLNDLMPQMLTLLPTTVATMKTMRSMLLTMQATNAGLQDQMAEMQENANAMGEAFDQARNDDSFYLPPEAFDNPDFQRGLEQFLSPDGHAVRFIISHQGDPMTPEGLAKIEPIKKAAVEAIKGTPLEGSRVYLGGTAAVFKDMSDGTKYDLIIAAIAAVCLIFIIMLILTRAVVAAAVIVGTVTLSLAASFGVSVLIWQYIVGLEMHWMVFPMALIILLAVGADYNLLVVARLREEIPAGLNTGMIRAMGGSGSVVTAAGLVFGLTMMVMVVSDLTVMGQVGTTIGLGLLFDTFVVRSFMMPSIATLLGRWFWWPQFVRKRPVPQPWPSVPPRGPATTDRVSV